MGFPPTPQTVSFVIPSKGQYRLGEIFPMKIEITGVQTAINAVQADVAFDPSRLEVVDISTDGSFANIFIHKDINNEVGYARLTGGLPNPGYNGENSLFGTIYFVSKIPGIVRIEFLPSSLVLANDGRGTNILKELSAVSYLVLPDRVSDEEDELQKSVIIESDVLGKSDDVTQLKFYSEGGVLGESINIGDLPDHSTQTYNDKVTKLPDENEMNWFVKLFLGIVHFIDEFILSFWKAIFQFIT